MKIPLLLCLLVLKGCFVGNDNKTMDKNSSEYQELMVYGNASSGLAYENGKFFAIDKKAADALNMMLRAFKFEVSELGSGITKDPITEDGAAIFTFKVYGDATSLRDMLLEHKELIDGAYIKPASEDPGGF